jgi:integrase
VPLFPALRELLQRIRGDRSPVPTDRVIPISDAKKAIGTACQKAKLPHFTHHTLRHYFVSNAIEAGVDFKVIASWVGHKDGGVLVAKTYGHLRDTHSFEMARRMTFSATSAETAPANIVPLAAAATT